MQNLSNKVVILNSKEDKNFKAILNLSNDKSYLKFYNMSKGIKNLALGIKQFSKVTKIPLNVTENISQFNLDKNIDITKDMTCAVVDVSNAFCPEILLSGSNSSDSDKVNIESAFSPTYPENPSALYEDTLDDELENMIDQNLQDDLHSTYFDSCETCKYRQAFYEDGGSIKCKCEQENLKKINNASNIASEENQIPHILSNEKNEQPNSKQESERNENNKNIDEEPHQTFYEEIKPQLDAIFKKYERETVLEQIIPHSIWAKVKYDDSKAYYVLGLLSGEDDQILYISYGMPSVDNKTPPEDLDGYAEFVPIYKNDPNSSGYWIVCQDAKTGETLKVKLI